MHKNLSCKAKSTFAFLFLALFIPTLQAAAESGEHKEQTIFFNSSLITYKSGENPYTLSRVELFKVPARDILLGSGELMCKKTDTSTYSATFTPTDIFPVTLNSFVAESYFKFLALALQEHKNNS